MNVESLYRDALALAINPDGNFLQLGRCLVALHDRFPDRFQTFTEQSGIGRRKAYYLLRISEQLAKIKKQGSKLDEDQLRRIGWTKLLLIAPQLTPKNAAKQLEMAEKETVRQIAMRLQGKKPAQKEHAMLLRFTPEQYQIFEEAILGNGAVRKPKGRGLLKKEEALIKIIQRSGSLTRG